MKIAWRRIVPGGIGLTTIVPLLVCPDDADLFCSVIVVEQEVSEDFIYWKRFGIAMDEPYDLVGATVRWLQEFRQAKFQKPEYCTALDLFQTLSGENWMQKLTTD
jgi:hypothetical protein